ncbi:MAG: hypothetical protein QW255_04635 [Candidatus Bilamarchaeaceae archaeon]
MSFIGINDYLRINNLPINYRSSFIRYANKFNLEFIDYDNLRYYKIEDLYKYFNEIHIPKPRKASLPLTPYVIMEKIPISLKEINDICKKFGYQYSFGLDDKLPNDIIAYLEKKYNIKFKGDANEKTNL